MPKGDAHYIRNTGQDTMRLVLGFSDAAAENLDFSACLPWVPSDLINQTLGVPAGTLPMLPVRGDLLLVQVEGAPAEIPSADPTPFSTTLDHLTTQAVAGGAIHPLRVDALPRLDSITVFNLVIDGGAVREPHWHGNASEFNYCVRGAAQLGIVAPSGESWTFTVEAGDVAFVPENWFHYIANVNDDEPAEFLAFFTNTVPSHVELSTMADYFPPEVMAASFGIDPGVFAALPKRGTVVIAPPLGADGGEATPEPATPAS
jgi:oxalate decarboxylase/phosphoglucose isomerase-like protein (cupin superfamily)